MSPCTVVVFALIEGTDAHRNAGWSITDGCNNLSDVITQLPHDDSNALKRFTDKVQGFSLGNTHRR